MLSKYFVVAAFAATTALSCAQAESPSSDAPIGKSVEKRSFQYLKAEDFVPQRVLPMPAPAGSELEASELATLHRMIATARPERLRQAVVDGAVQDPSIFNVAVGTDLAKLPATWKLLVSVQAEAEAAIGAGKEAFNRMRPYDVDGTLQSCAKGRGKAARSYPSGHAALGWSVAWMLAHVLPEQAPAILDRANQYALSRQFCGVHYPSDTEASHVLATVVADRLLNDPRLAGQIAAARAELAQAVNHPSNAPQK